MYKALPRPFRLASLLVSAVLGAGALGACSDQLAAPVLTPEATAPASALQAFDCVATTSTMRCTAATPGMGTALGAIMAGQNTLLKLTSSNAGYDAGTQTFSVDVTIQNLMNESMGTPDGVTPDPAGIMVFFMADPSPTSGTGDVSVSNADGNAFFTSASQAYHTYNEILDKDEVSSAKTWQFHMDPTVGSFRFQVLVATSMDYDLVINEVMANPTPLTDTDQEWVELYNAGSLPVDLQSLVIADSAASGRRPYHLISSSVVVQPGGYVVLGSSTNTTLNGGVPVDYSYGGALALANSLDAVKIARVMGMDTLTLDRTQYSNAAVSAQSGVSRELKNPALDNSNMDGSNWGDASVTSVYGSGGRGTPKAQNSAYTP